VSGRVGNASRITRADTICRQLQGRLLHSLREVPSSATAEDLQPWHSGEMPHFMETSSLLVYRDTARARRRFSPTSTALHLGFAQTVANNLRSSFNVSEVYYEAGSLDRLSRAAERGRGMCRAMIKMYLETSVGNALSAI
jgi:hypothetical protein